MDRKKFIKNALSSAAGIVAGKSYLNSKDNNAKVSTYDKLIQQVGFNHLPNKESKTMKSVLHKADSRGTADHGWLKSKHSFSFANYHNPERMHFGVIRVLNDDIVDGGKGFGTHPHDNMEIISIPLEGSLEHKDNMGNITEIKKGDIQVMSAGTGISHSEYNKKKIDQVKFLQIWLFPNKKNVEPRYDQITLDPAFSKNTFQQILSPNPGDAGVWIHQNAWFQLAEFENNFSDTYHIKSTGNGIYAFVLEGEVTIENQKLEPRDGFGIWDVESVNIKANSAAKFLLMDVPMKLT